MTDYGTDTSCTTSLRTGRLVSGLRLVAEAAYRRITTPRGTLRGGEDEANYGMDLEELVGSGDPVALAATLPGRIRNELLKDERIDEVDAEVVSTTEGPSTSFDISIVGTTAEGQFELVLGARDVKLSLLKIEPET